MSFDPKSIANDALCYPPLDRNKDIFQKDMSFAQRLRSHIEFCVAPPQREDAEDPTQIVIY